MHAELAVRPAAAAATHWLLGQVRARAVGHGYSYPRAAVDGAASGAPSRSANGKGVRLQPAPGPTKGTGSSHRGVVWARGLLLKVVAHGIGGCWNTFVYHRSARTCGTIVLYAHHFVCISLRPNDKSRARIVPDTRFITHKQA